MNFGFKKNGKKMDGLKFWIKYMKKIKELTAKQKIELKQFHQRYFEMGSSTDPIDEIELKKAISDFYRRIDQKEPVYIICDSPYTSMLMLKGILPKLLKDEASLNGLWSSLWSSLESSLRNSLGNSLESSLRSSLGNSLRSSLWSSLESSLRNSLRSSLWSSLGNSLGNSLESSLWSSLRNSLWSSLESSLRSSLGNSLRSSLWSSLESSKENLFDGDYFSGSIQAYWISFYQFCEHIGVAYEPQYAEILDGWENIAKHSFHWWPKNGLCVCSRKPTKISWNERDPKTLHADGEMAVQFADGWGIYCYNGVMLREEIGSTKSKDWKPEWILTEQNQEVRRLLLETIEMDKVQSVLDLKTIDVYQSAVSKYELVEARNNPYPSRYRALRMSCPSTNKPYLIRVHPDTEKAERAVVEFNRGVHPDTFVMEH